MTDELPAGKPDAPAGPGQGISLASVGRSAAILAGATAAVQVLGIVQWLFLAARVGISADFDALLIGLVLPATLGSVLTAGVSTALVPAYLEARATRSIGDARRLAGTVLTWMTMAGILVFVLLEVLAPIAVVVTGPGLSEAGRDQAAAYLRFLAPSTIIAAISGILYAVCQAEEQFPTIAWSIFAGAAVALAMMLVLWDALNLWAYAVGTLVGPIVSMVLLLVAAIRRGVAPRPHLISRGLGLGAFARHAFPLTVSSAILQVNAIFDRAVASMLAPGAVSALRYGDTLVRVPTGAISPAWGAAIYPALVRSTHEDGRSRLASATEQALRYVTAVFVPISALTLAVAPLAVAVAYGRGEFTSADLQLTALVVAGFAPLVFTLMLSQTLTGALNARRSGGVLLTAGVINVILNCTLDIVLGLPLGVAGVALSSSVTAVVVAIFKARRLARQEESFHLRPLARHITIAIAASLPCALAFGALSWTGHYPDGAIAGLVTLAAYGVVGMLVYAVIASRLGLKEPMILARLALRRLSPGIRTAPPAA